jgi:hypothetical protein
MLISRVAGINGRGLRVQAKIGLFRIHKKRIRNYIPRTSNDGDLLDQGIDTVNGIKFNISPIHKAAS